LWFEQTYKEEEGSSKNGFKPTKSATFMSSSPLHRKVGGVKVRGDKIYKSCYVDPEFIFCQILESKDVRLGGPDRVREGDTILDR
jgi:hypothetical protein